MNKLVVAIPATVPDHVKRNLEHYLKREAEGDSEASQTILQISNRWGF